MNDYIIPISVVVAILIILCVLAAGTLISKEMKYEFCQQTIDPITCIMMRE